MYTRKPLDLKTFASDDRGTVAMTFGIMASALLFMAGMAVDYTRAVDVRTRVADAADAAALAAGRALLDGQMTVSEIKTLAERYFDQNVQSVKSQAKIGTPVINVDPNTGGVTVDVKSSVNLTLARVMGKQTLDFPVSAAVNFTQKDIEIGMALDITGSMRDPSFDGSRKIDGLKKAFETFATRLIPETPNAQHKVRIGIAPYAHTVNLGGYADSILRTRATTCATERKDGRYSDAAGDFHPMNGACVGSESTLIPLSDDRDGLIDTVNKFKTYNSTAGHLGVQWAWNIVSPKWAATWGGDAAPDSMERVEEKKLLKAVVLMTDGIFNTQYHGPASRRQAVEMCNAMKAEGIVVFSVAFSGPREAADEATLKACASPGDGYYANASSTDELERAFTNFAAKLSELRITK